MFLWRAVLIQEKYKSLTVVTAVKFYLTVSGSKLITVNFELLKKSLIRTTQVLQNWGLFQYCWNQLLVYKMSK